MSNVTQVLFSKRVRSALAQAKADAAPLHPTPSQIEAAMLPLVKEILVLPEQLRSSYLWESFTPGTIDDLPIRMLRKCV